jgi:Xaa-Pro aminopeptidase
MAAILAACANDNGTGSGGGQGSRALQLARPDSPVTLPLTDQTTGDCRRADAECLVHGIGLEEENPSVCHPPDGQPNGDNVLEPGTILVVECYMGEVGGDHGVKLGDQVLVTQDGCRTLVPYPWSASLLG